jgi:hypothetical protein
MNDARDDGAVQPRAPGESGLDQSLVEEDLWSCLRVIRRLEVGPIRLEPQRVVAPYTVVTDSGSDTTELIYRFGPKVFYPADPGAHNLASMMAAQVALNYGLFADEIHFLGTYDAVDREFLRDMAENTAREIAVKKFLEPNPFLRGQAANLPAIKRQRYCHARIRFPVATGSAGRGEVRVIEPWSDDPSRHAILSSGGKESLLTLGLLREIGCDTYPIFVNESGRHWLTALNAYRHLAASHPGTGRVWTNSDRVFAWFLRRLPFVRQDFANVRSDEYPIRLWTVAVFLFGVLPLMRVNRVGRLLIGDEFDTTRRAYHRGIPHYDGLYDQSRYFDQMVGRYFQRKGFAVAQFSAVRNLSEPLVQKILAERYTDLFEHQVSCHATHQDGVRVRPCGRCEKCRRVVGMLVAFQLDPKRCGYTDEQVAGCLAAFASAGVNQESIGAQHLAYLLTQRGLLPNGAAGLAAPRMRSEVMMLRFDPDKSPLDGMPPDLRGPVFRILLQHAEGALRRVGRDWQRFDPLDDAGRKHPNDV